MNEIIGLIGISITLGILIYGIYIISKPHKFSI